MLVCQFFPESYPFLRIHQIDIPVGIAWTAGDFRRVGIRKNRFSDPSFFGSYYHNTVFCTWTVYSSSRSVFQHIDPFDILRIDTGNGITDNIQIIGIIQIVGIDIDRVCHHDTVQYPQRLPVSQQSRSSPDT